jgi:hypothetical protein
MIVRREDLKALGFRKIEQYFGYIVESRYNGQHTQAKELFYDLEEGMQGQRVAFYRWLPEIGEDAHKWQEYLRCFIAF